MDTIKNLLHKDKKDKQDEAGATGKLTGEGTHFGSDKPQYGAVPGVGISSFTEGQTQCHTGSTGTTTAAHDTTGAANSSSGAPQVSKPDFGDRLIDPAATTTSSAIGSTSGTSFPSKPTDDVASVGSVKSGVQGIGGSNTLDRTKPLDPVATSHSTSATVTGLSGTALVDRSIPPGNSATVAEPYTERAFPLGGSATAAASTEVPTRTQNWPDGGAVSSLDQGAISSTSGISGHHPTFTGERLDAAHAGHQQGRSFNEPEVTLAESNLPVSTTQHHGQRDAAAVGGAAGVAGAGIHEHEKHEHTKEHDEHHKDSKLQMLGLRHTDPLHFQHDGDPEHTAKEKYFGGAAAAAHDPSASGIPESKHHHEERDAAVVGGAAAAAAGTASHEKHEHHKHEHSKESGEAGEKKHGLLDKIFHRDNANKLHKDPPEGEAPLAAHETFVKPGPHHEQHIGIDGPIGRVGEVSGVGGSDARHTVPASEIPKDLEIKPAAVPPTPQERAEAAPQGVVIEPRTGLPMNVGKYGTGQGGTDGASQIAGYDEKVNAERLAERDGLLHKSQEQTWDKIADERSGAPDNPTALAVKMNEDVAPLPPTHGS